MTNLAVQVKDVYGVTLIYPDCVRSRLLAKLLGRKTFTTKDIEILEQLDYQFVATHHNIFTFKSKGTR